MSSLIVELTDRCNLSCRHCPSGRHGGRGELDLALFDRVLDQARAQGIDRLSFTGGEPTLHPRFPDILHHTTAAGYRFGLVTNGWVVAQRLEQLLPYRDWLSVITFSLDGGREASHDAQRGAGSFRRVMQAAYDFPVALSPGSPTPDLFPCAPLHNDSFNLDWQGNLGLCCHLSSLETGAVEEVAGNLWTLALGEALERLRLIRQRLHADKLRRQAEGRWRNNDDFPCWYCVRHFQKANWLRRCPHHPWYAALNEE